MGPTGLEPDEGQTRSAERMPGAFATLGTRVPPRRRSRGVRRETRVHQKTIAQRKGSNLTRGRREAAERMPGAFATLGTRAPPRRRSRGVRRESGTRVHPGPPIPQTPHAHRSRTHKQQTPRLGTDGAFALLVGPSGLEPLTSSMSKIRRPIRNPTQKHALTSQAPATTADAVVTEVDIHGQQLTQMLRYLQQMQHDLHLTKALSPVIAR